MYIVIVPIPIPTVFYLNNNNVNMLQNCFKLTSFVSVTQSMTNATFKYL